jgi:hypothetical protein
MSGDYVIWRRDLRAALNNVSDETLRQWLKTGKLPPPDIDLSQRTRGWRLSTLRRAGIKLSAASIPAVAG